MLGETFGRSLTLPCRSDCQAPGTCGKEPRLTSIAVALTTFAVILLAELPDKTALASLVLGTRYRPAPVLCAVTGPRRALVPPLNWPIHLAVPYGDMMLTGCFGLLRALAAHWPSGRAEIERRLRET